MANVNWKQDRIGSAIRGENPLVIAEMRSGFAVIGDTQFLPGYCVLLPSRNVGSLIELSYRQKSEYLLDMSILGDAIQKALNPRRINYSIYGNTDPFLHAHVFPRYEWESEERKCMPAWLYPKEMWSEVQHHYSNEKHGELREKIRSHLLELLKEAYTQA
jgi:diadenosine tetraphosphate (Ap4A) HIT family hydrolase